MTKEAKALIAIAIVVVIGGILLAIFANPQPTEPGQVIDDKSLIRENSHMTKSASAKVNLVEFGDFECPGCAAAAPRIKEVNEFYKDNPDVNFVFRNYPLDSIHKNAHLASEAAEEAGKQGKYWEMHYMLFERQQQWAGNPNPIDIFVSFASELGLDVDQFRSNVSQRIYADVIKADQEDGQKSGVASTPTFFINGEKLTTPSVPTVEELKKFIDEALAKANGTQPEPAAGTDSAAGGTVLEGAPQPSPENAPVQ